MPTLGFHREFIKEFAGLERHVQRRVVDALDKFEHTSAAGGHRRTSLP
jgi:hypothetical protein